ncbi:hypothetical protein [Desulfospira joergensenii]|uniref:hypothetical protein n=1 Tax=Desulfospira joergensenii TaxID=53329 RepID=UPI0003B5CD41|nr:hypothetical protein [Desulfospira joergensenii]
MKKCFLFACISLFIFGCASKGPDLSKLNSLQPGISRSELAKFFNDKAPVSTDFIDGCFLLKYPMYDSHDIGTRPYYFVFNQNDSLIGWEEIRGQKQIIVGGVTIAIPMPSR